MMMTTTTKIPVSLSHQNVILIGKKSIIDRIRINTISLILLWIITSTKFFLAPTSSNSNSTTIVPPNNPNLTATSTTTSSHSHLSSLASATAHNPNLIPPS
ncbi:hypothetical protein Pst134EB_010842 [Puccinia striiformis f. sp. tritici]|nr:hypothetical protein Pst134EB_010842 [Puccinia striiformis f. sp. tritici]